MENINTKGYWEKRFKSGNWGKSGSFQTYQYASHNVKHLSISKDFQGSVLDFGCALGDSIPIYRSYFPNAKLFGIDISASAIKICKKRFGNIAKFKAGDYTSIEQKDVIVASHVMEHLSNDKEIVSRLLSLCSDLFIFVPYKESPLYIEHVNYYDDNYYNDFEIEKVKSFTILVKRKQGILKTIKSVIKRRPSLYAEYPQDVIMYHLKGKYKK